MTFEQLWPLGLYVVFSAAVQALPDPEDGDAKWYRFLYNFSHALAANVNVVRKNMSK